MKNFYIENTNQNNIVPIFYACDDNFVKYTIVSIRSLIDNSAKDRIYKIYILNTGIGETMIKETKKLETENVSIEFVDVETQLDSIGRVLPLRDYYSKTTYFRMFIAEMFPMYDKAIYIDSDTVVTGDISELFNMDLKGNYVGACHEQAMVQTEVFGNYVEKVMGISRNFYFNAGVLLINCDLFRKDKVLSRFIDLLGVYTFVVTQDEDYLNVICHNRVLWLDDGYNTEVYGDIKVKEEDIKIIHYIMTSKPWHYEDCRLKEYFWKYAEKTSVYHSIKQEFDSYTDAERERDRASCVKLAETAAKEAEREDTYLAVICKKKVSGGFRLLKKFASLKLKENLI